MSVMLIPEAAFESKLLDRDYHDRLIANLKTHAMQAGIPPSYVWTRLSKYCSAVEMDWVRNMRHSEDNGLVFSGTEFNVPVEDKMMAITGACLRNYIDARVMTVQELLGRLKNDDPPGHTLVLVPNFCMAKDDKSSVAPWQAASLLGWLYSRLSNNQKAVLYVGSIKTLEEVYGEAMARHIKSHYSFI